MGVRLNFLLCGFNLIDINTCVTCNVMRRCIHQQRNGRNEMTNLIENLINKASKKGVDVKLDGELTLRYKKTKFKTWSGKFIYETRKELLVSLLFLAKKGYPTP